MSGNPLYFIIASNNYKSCNLIGPYHILGIGNLTGAPDCFAGGGGGGGGGGVGGLRVGLVWASDCMLPSRKMTNVMTAFLFSPPQVLHDPCYFDSSILYVFFSVRHSCVLAHPGTILHHPLLHHHEEADYGKWSLMRALGKLKEMLLAVPGQVCIY